MKKLSFFLMAMLMSVMSFAQTTESVDLASGVHDGSKITWTIANGNITISQLKAASSTAVNASYISAPRMYKGHIFKFETAEGYAITNIDITYNGSYYGTDLFAGTVIGNNTVTKNTTDITATYSTATGGTHKIATTSAEGESMIALQIPNSAASGYKQLRPTAIKITYVKAATTTPNISCGDVTFGTVNSINNNTKEVEVVGENLSEAITATLETGAAFSVEGTLNANGGILTIKVTATEEGNYTDNLVLTSGTTTKTVAVSAKVVTCEGKGTKEAPYTVSDLTKLGNPGTKAWVMGYIIGEIKDNELSTSGFENNSNIALADAIGETKKYAPIQLPSGAIRDALNLVSNPANLNKQVALYGTLEAYFSMPGVKSVSEYEWVVASVVNHTITVSANPAEGGVVTGGDEYEEGATATLTATANEGYEFVNWTENEVEVSTDAEYTFEVLADRALVANFEKAAPTTETVYFVNAQGWDKVNIYTWTPEVGGWPGVAMTKEAEQLAGYDVYSYTVEKGTAFGGMLFNCGGDECKTGDLVWEAGKYYVIDGWYTKEEAEAKLAAPIADIWTVAGAPASIFGTEWDPSNAANDLVKQEDGTYKWEKADLTLATSSIQFKVVKNHAWGEEYPGSNYTLSIAEAGIYTITITFNADTKEVAGTATKTGSAVVIPTIAIAGDMNGWNTTANEFVVAADELTASLTLPLEAQDYGFKIIVAGGWTSNAATITRENNTAEFTENGDNSTLTADVAGEYTFTWTYATKTLTVTYPALPVKYNVTVTAENGTVTGAGEYVEGTTATLTATPAEGYQFVNWTVGEEVVSTENPYTFTVTADIALVANFELIPVVEPEKPEPTYTDNILNPYAFGLESVLSEDKATLTVTYRLNNTKATAVDVVVYNGEEVVKVVTGTKEMGKNTVEIPTEGLPAFKNLTWSVKVKGSSVEAPTQEAKIYSFYHPSSVDIDNNPENPTFGMLLVNEGMQKVKGTNGYTSTGFGAGIFAFTPSFDLIPNGDQPGYNGGIEFTNGRYDASGSTAYAPRRIRISEDGRIFVTSLNTDGNYLWEVNPENMNEWTPIFKGASVNENFEVVDAEGKFIAAPNAGFDVKGSGEDLQLLMLSVSKGGFPSTYAQSAFQCYEYNLGTNTTWDASPSKLIFTRYAINYTGVQVQYDNEGGVWMCQNQSATTDTKPSLIHVNAAGEVDLIETVNNRLNGGIRFNNDFTKVIIAGIDAGTNKSKKATIYTISKNENGAPVLSPETVVDMTAVGNNLNDFAWDYAGNLYACGNSSEKLAAWAMPYSGEVETPAASKYAFQLEGQLAETWDVTMTNLQVDDYGESIGLSADDKNTGLNVWLTIDTNGVIIPDYSSAAIVQGWSEIELPIVAGNLTKTYVDSLDTDVYSGLVIAEYEGGYLGLNLTMYYVPVPPVVVIVENATVDDQTENTGIMYMKGQWTDAESVVYPVTVEVPGFDATLAETVYDNVTVTVGGMDDEPWLGFGQGSATVTIANNLVTLKSVVSDWGGTVIDITISGNLSQGPGTALDNIAVEAKTIKMIKNGQLIIIKNGVQYNVQGQVIK